MSFSFPPVVPGSPAPADFSSPLEESVTAASASSAAAAATEPVALDPSAATSCGAIACDADRAARSSPMRASADSSEERSFGIGRGECAASARAMLRRASQPNGQKREPRVRRSATSGSGSTPSADSSNRPSARNASPARSARAMQSAPARSACVFASHPAVASYAEVIVPIGMPASRALRTARATASSAAAGATPPRSWSGCDDSNAPRAACAPASAAAWAAAIMASTCALVTSAFTVRERSNTAPGSGRSASSASRAAAP